MNTDRNLLFLILSLASVYMVFDEFYGQQRISKIADKLTPSFPSPSDIVGGIVEDAKDKVEEKIKEPIKDAGEKLNEKAPNVFYDKDSKDDKKKDEKKDDLLSELRKHFWNGWGGPA